MLCAMYHRDSVSGKASAATWQAGAAEDTPAFAPLGRILCSSGGPQGAQGSGIWMESEDEDEFGELLEVELELLLVDVVFSGETESV